MKMSDRTLKQHFRLTRTSFNYVCNAIGQTIDTNNCVRTTNVVSVECKVAVTLWKLATHLEYRSTGIIFKMSRSVADMWKNKVIIEICRCLYNSIRIDDTQQGLTTLKEGFGRRGFLQCADVND